MSVLGYTEEDYTSWAVDALKQAMESLAGAAVCFNAAEKTALSAECGAMSEAVHRMLQPFEDGG